MAVAVSPQRRCTSEQKEPERGSNPQHEARAAVLVLVHGGVG